MFAIATIATAQIKIAANGNVGIGGIIPCWECKLQIQDGTNNISIAPNAGGTNIGAYIPGESTTRLDFWHTVGKWNNVRFKGSSLSSDSTLKTNIIPLTNATNLLQQVKTYSYFFKTDSIYIRSDSIDERKREYGVLAQEIKEFLPELVDTAKGTMFVNYNAFIGILIAGFNEQQKVIEFQQIEMGNQQNEIEILQQVAFVQEQDIIKLKDLQKAFNELQDIVYECCKPKNMSPPLQIEEPLPEGETAILYQNTPNPFTSNTEIVCYLPETTIQATLFIYNLQGAQLKEFFLTQTGMNTIIVNGSELPAGMYLYTLVVNNEIIDTKRMILTK